MPSVPKVLGQSAPAAASQVDLYTVPTLSSAVSSSLTACNTNTVGTQVTVRVSRGGAVDDPSQSVYNMVSVVPNETFTATIGMTLSAGDKVRVTSSQSGCAFTLFGTENT